MTQIASILHEKSDNILDNDSVFAVVPNTINEILWLKSLIALSNLKLIVLGSTPLDKILNAIKDVHNILVFIDLHSLSGTKAIDFVESQEKTIRNITPNAGIVLTTKAKLNIRLLPSCTYLIHEQSTISDIMTIINLIKISKEDKCSLYRTWSIKSTSNLKRHHSKISNHSFLNFQHPIPTFNIKHPSMLIPIALVSERTGIPVFCEISPQESLSFYSKNIVINEYDYRTLVNSSLTKIKEDFDFVQKTSKAQIKLHLDHCNDPKIIQHALSLGFDSIMADGSQYSLNKNIQFTKDAYNHIKQYGALIEGEVGAIDIKGIRRSSKSSITDVEDFLDNVNVDYLAINIGQKHGSDYEFDRSRYAFRELIELEFFHCNQDSRSLYQACLKIDNKLQNNGFSIFSKERNMIKQIKKLISSEDTNLVDLINKISLDLDIQGFYWLTELQYQWNQHKLMVAKKRKKLYKKIIGFGVGSKEPNKRILDFDILSHVSRISKNANTRIVIHGGSSISYPDLKDLHKYNVSRVNFGSEPFKSFLNSILAESIESIESNLNDPIYCTHFMNDNLSDWKSWMSFTPSFLEAFQDELEKRYFSSLSNLK